MYIIYFVGYCYIELSLVNIEFFFELVNKEIDVFLEIKNWRNLLGEEKDRKSFWDINLCFGFFIVNYFICLKVKREGIYIFCVNKGWSCKI